MSSRNRKRKRGHSSSGKRARKRRKVTMTIGDKKDARERELVHLVGLYGNISAENVHKQLIARIASGIVPDVPSSPATVLRSLRILVAKGELIRNADYRYILPSVPAPVFANVAVNDVVNVSENDVVNVSENDVVCVVEDDVDAGSAENPVQGDKGNDIVTDAIDVSSSDSSSSSSSDSDSSSNDDSSSSDDSDSDSDDLECRTVRLCVPIHGYLQKYTIAMEPRKRKLKRKR